MVERRQDSLGADEGLTGVEAFLDTAKKRWLTIKNAEATLREDMIDDMRFRSGDQWPDTIKVTRQVDGRPCITVNRIPQFLRQVTNQQRSARPGIKVNPVEDGADEELAEVLQGIVRHIEVKSDADIAYSHAGEDQVTMGRGYWRVLTHWADDKTTRQELRIERIRNPLTVYMDVTAKEPDYSDARYAFIVEDISRPEFERRFGDAAYGSLDDWSSVYSEDPDWMPEGKVRIAEYFYFETTEQEIIEVRTPSGTSALFTPEQIDEFPISLQNQLIVTNTRVIEKRQLHWCLFNAVEVLEGNDGKSAGREVDGKWIPIIPVIGDTIDLNGKIDLRGMVRDAKDPQRMYNFWVSAETEVIALAPRSPFIGAEGQFSGHEEKWKTANTRNWAYLEYKMKALGNSPAPPPQRNQYEPPIAAIIQATAQSDNDLKAVMGIYDASLGQSGPEQSGKAIIARQTQSDTANSNFMDNQARSIRHTGRILVDLIPIVYDVPQVMQIIGEDDKRTGVIVHAGQPPSPESQKRMGGGPQQQPQPPGPQRMIGPQGAPGGQGQPGAAPQGGAPAPGPGGAPGGPGGGMPPEKVLKVFDLSVGKFDVTISVGPSTSTRRQEAVQAMVEFVRAYPNSFPLIGDLLAKNMDWAGAQEVAARLAKALPPQLQDGDVSQFSPEAQAMIAQLNTALQQMQGQMGEMQKAIETDRVKMEAQIAMKRAELGSEERIVALKEQNENLRAAAELNEREGRSQLQAQIDRMSQLLQHMTTRQDQALKAEEIGVKRQAETNKARALVSANREKSK